MNEQLIVKNFGPIKDATVDFKRVTVFIGPTGGGKSTLAKLAAIFRGDNFFGAKRNVRQKQFDNFALTNFFLPNSWFHWVGEGNYESYEITANLTQSQTFVDNKRNINGSYLAETKDQSRSEILKEIIDEGDYAEIQKAIANYPGGEQAINPKLLRVFKQLGYLVAESLQTPQSVYFPSNRALVPAVEYSWAGLLRDDIGLPKDILDFANDFSLSRKNVPELDIKFLNVKYLHENGQDFIKIPGVETRFRLYETASGIQSVTPLLVLLEHLSRNTEQAQSFIIEEPELNLYPTAQRDLVYWLLEKCTQGNNDLTITTHSPYVLSALNLALYAGKVAALFPHQCQKVAKIIPEKYWLKADEFSAYHVAGGGVKSIFGKKTGLLSESQLDEVSGHFADVFDRLTDLRVPEKKALAKAKSVKK